MDLETHISKPVAPEDIRPGDYLMPLYQVVEHTPLPWEPLESWQRGEPQRSLRLPWGTPLPALVLETSLPFVLVRTARGKHLSIDVRRYRLGRVSGRYGRLAFAGAAEEKRKEEAAERGDSSGAPA